MSPGIESIYRPDPERAKRYDRLYEDYLALGGFVEAQVEAQIAREPEMSKLET